jgi:protein-S-isoprenylcysteine O-methyltransferase Ste14
VDRFRYYFAVLNLIVLPSGLLFWFLIHSWAPQWRRLGALGTYLIVLTLVGGLGTLLYKFREPLIAADLGTHWPLVVAALAFYVASVPLERGYWKQLKFSTLVGLPEVSRAHEAKGRLIREGIYGVIRHPRYASAGLGVIGNFLLANYAGSYVLAVLLVPLGYAMIKLEERELASRFGKEYFDYEREVPRLIPHDWLKRRKIPPSPK